MLAHSIYVDELQQNHEIKATALDFYGDDTFLEISKQLQSKLISSYVYDITVLQAYLQGDLACSYSFVGGLIDPFNYAYTFSPTFNDTLLIQFNSGLMAAQV